MIIFCVCTSCPLPQNIEYSNCMIWRFTSSRGQRRHFFSILNITDPADTFKWISLSLRYHGIWVPWVSNIRHRKSLLKSLGILQSTVGFSVTLFLFRSHPLHQSCCVTTSTWIKHAFYLATALEEFQIMTHRLKRITLINRGIQGLLSASWGKVLTIETRHV